MLQIYSCGDYVLAVCVVCVDAVCIGKTLCRHWIHGDPPLDSSAIGYMETVIGYMVTAIGYMDAAMGYIDGRGVQFL